MNKITYTISHPESGDCRDFNSKRSAILFAKKQEYTPVFVDIYDEEMADIIGDIRINNAGKKEL